MIHQLVYISTTRSPMEDATLEDILAVSRSNNEMIGVTGLLVAGGNRFLQLLEGTVDAVQETFARIRADNRHFATVVLDARMVEQRQCPDWSMGYVRGGAAAETGQLPAIVAALTAPIADKMLRAQFTGFAELHGRAA